jgi:sugar phosphate isomerase/epimerase
MKLGVFTPVFAKLCAEQMLAKVRSLGGVEAIEIGTGGWPGRDHLDLDRLQEPCRAREYKQMVADAGLSISALSCHSNPLHPDDWVAKAADELFRKTVVLAEHMQVPVVVTFSGCPGDAETASHPNWITTPWPPEFEDVLEWQWETKAIPYWKRAGAFASSHGVKVALEPHPGFLVYNVRTALRLRDATDPAVGVNFDPSHLYWQGADMPSAIQALGPAIFHVHAKDVAFNRRNVDVNGVLDHTSYRALADRSWSFRSVGWGHDALEWKRIVSALRIIGYDYVLSIEHEDALASIDEGLRAAIDLLQGVVLREPPAEPWWT